MICKEKKKNEIYMYDLYGLKFRNRNVCQSWDHQSIICFMTKLIFK